MLVDTTERTKGFNNVMIGNIKPNRTFIRDVLYCLLPFLHQLVRVLCTYKNRNKQGQWQCNLSLENEDIGNQH